VWTTSKSDPQTGVRRRLPIGVAEVEAKQPGVGFAVALPLGDWVRDRPLPEDRRAGTRMRPVIDGVCVLDRLSGRIARYLRGRDQPRDHDSRGRCLRDNGDAKDS
jgi:hypothetical protein